MGINEAWKDACRLLLGDEIGELDSFKEYLSERLDISISEKKSALSGKKLFASSSAVCEGAKFINSDEAGKYLELAGKEKLDINQVKDVDSILEALSEKFYYAGSIRLGKFQDISESDRCTDSSFIHHSQMVYENSKYIAFANMARKNEYCFGVTVPGESKFLICAYLSWRNARCFEAMRVFNSSDCYYVANMDGCTSCMFSFNQRNRSNCIGNLQLPKDKYTALRQKLVEEIREALRTRKKAPHIFELIADCRRPRAKAVELGKEILPPSFSAVEKAFETTSSVVLGRKLGPLKDYEKYLVRDVGQVIAVESVISGKPVMIPPVPVILAVKDNVMTLAESLEFGKNRLDEKELDDFTLSNASPKLERIKSIAVDSDIGTNVNLLQCAVSGNDCANSFRGFLVFKAKNTAYVRWPRDSEYAFGSSNLVLSKFCIKCYNSVNLTRCFEVEGSNNCSDSLFCHNCEGLDNCMFCFNSKSLRYAIGNVELGREKYMEIRKRVLDELAGKLEKDKFLELSIYNIGCRKSKG